MLGAKDNAERLTEIIQRVIKPMDPIITDEELKPYLLSGVAREEAIEQITANRNKQKLAAKSDPGAHYRFHYKGIQLDPYRIAKVYGITDHAQFSALKKILCAGSRGHKGLLQDISDSICALERWRQMLEEDSEIEN